MTDIKYISTLIKEIREDKRNQPDCWQYNGQVETK